MTSATQTQADDIRRQWTLAGVPAGAEPVVLAELLAGRGLPGEKPRVIVHVAANDRHMDLLAQGLAFFAPKAEVMHFPAWDCMPYDRASPLPALMAARMQVLAALAGRQGDAPVIVLTTAGAVIQKLPPRAMMREISFTLAKGKRLDRDKLLAYLAGQGYRRVGKAMEPGEYAVRGSIIDLVPAGMSEGIRLDLFGDEVESIKSYDLLSQLTQGKLDSVALYPVSEVVLNEETIQRFRERYRELFGAVSKEDPLYEAVSEGSSYPGMEHWLPLFYDHTETLLDYCGKDALVTLGHEVPAAIEDKQESILDYYEARTTTEKVSGKNSFSAGGVYHPVPVAQAFVMPEAWEKLLAAHPHAVFTPFVEKETPRSVAMGYRTGLRFPQGGERTPFELLRDKVQGASEAGKSTLLACFSEGSRERLQTILMERGFHCVRVESWQEMKKVSGKSLGLAVLPLESGFETDKAVVLSEQDVLGERIARAKSKKKKSDVFLMEAANFGEGELVVHKEHGIGRFEGLVTLTVSGAAHDCLKIIYEGDDKLFLPVENIDMVSRFGLEDEGVKLDKLGGASWQARKAKLKQRIKIAAEALLKTAAERQVREGAVIDVPTGTYEDFCARFPYVETEDQARAIADVLEDLHSGRPMDRLVCGDVGFGKTEVALRAAFVAAMGDCDVEMGRCEDGKNKKDFSTSPHPHIQNNYQVAVVVPTTLLARQHFRNFEARFKGFPVVVRQLSRMVPTKDQKETREQLAEGKVDIVVGTHALLSKQVAFKNLGLMIVDEEQHFGVVQKEKMKELKSDIHVLTLSATPIPRTLQMALTGVRDLSLITTPPVDRLAVRSFVMPFDPVVIREAVMREIHRGGKCFLVTPRIKDIADLKAQITELVPEARIAVAHGQMAASDLDKIMNEFYDGKFDILLSTAIIESGLDIPTANTMIIHNAHLLGLSQLYQLRGRVGRGKIRAYAYFLLPHYKQLTKNATRRLEVMQTLDTLGAGFTLASHDMDIRGFGNLVGEEQSGHIREVGIELYQQMLEEAVEALKRKDGGLRTADDGNGAAPDADWSPQINLGIPVLIPESYVNDLQLRLGLYRRVASLADGGEIDSFAAELVDRFGPMPEEASYLIAVLGIKLLCKHAGIERIDAGPKGAVISFHGNAFAKPEALLQHIERHPRQLKVRPDQKLVFTHEWKNVADKLATVRKLVEDVAALLN